MSLHTKSACSACSACPLPAPASRPSRHQTAPRKRLLLLGANGIGTGRGTFESGVMEHAGWTNYFAG